MCRDDLISPIRREFHPRPIEFTRKSRYSFVAYYYDISCAFASRFQPCPPNSIGRTRSDAGLIVNRVVRTIESGVSQRSNGIGPDPPRLLRRRYQWTQACDVSPRQANELARAHEEVPTRYASGIVTEISGRVVRGVTDYAMCCYNDTALR